MAAPTLMLSRDGHAQVEHGGPTESIQRLWTCDDLRRELRRLQLEVDDPLHSRLTRSVGGGGGDVVVVEDGVSPPPSSSLSSSSKSSSSLSSSSSSSSSSLSSFSSSSSSSSSLHSVPLLLLRGFNTPLVELVMPRKAIQIDDQTVILPSLSTGPPLWTRHPLLSRTRAMRLGALPMRLWVAPLTFWPLTSRQVVSRVRSMPSPMRRGPRKILKHRTWVVVQTGSVPVCPLCRAACPFPRACYRHALVSAV